MGVDAGRILAQHLLHSAEPLEAFLPVEQGKLAQARKSIPNGELILCLAILLQQDEIIHGFVECALQPALHRNQRRPLVIEIINQLRGEIGAWAGIGFGQLRHDRKDLVGIAPVGRNQPVRPEIGNSLLSQFGQGSVGELPNALNQYHAQHQRDGPEFANRDRSHRLIGLNEGQDALLVQAHLGVGGQFPRQAVDAWQTAVGLARERRELPVIPPRQIQPHVTGIAFKDVFIVEEPLRGRRHALLQMGRFG